MRIGFRVDCNLLSGFGHFSRTLNLCRTWISIGGIENLLFIGNYNFFALNLLQKYNIPYVSIYGEQYDIISEKEILDFDVVLFDSYFMSQQKIDYISKAVFKTIIIDDECKFDYQGIDIIINFRFNAEILYRYNSKHQFLGVKYFIVKPELVALREKNKSKSAQLYSVSKLLIFLGGSFSNNEVLRQIISRINTASLHTEVLVLGHRTSFQNCRYIDLEPRFDIENIFSQVDAVINGGGIIKYEASYSLIPTASFSTTKLQLEDSEILSASNVHYNLGYIYKEVTGEVLQKIDFFLSDASFRETLIASNKRNYTDNPTYELIQNIKHIL